MDLFGRGNEVFHPISMLHTHSSDAIDLTINNAGAELSGPPYDVVRGMNSCHAVRNTTNCCGDHGVRRLPTASASVDVTM